MERELPAVRLADPGDEQDLVGLCQHFHEENGIFSYAPAKVERIIQDATHKRAGILGVIGKPVEAMVCLAISQLWYTEDYHLADMFSFVKKEFRRSNNAESLIAFSKHCSDRISLPLVLGIVSSKRTEAKIRLYRKFLGLPMGAFFIYGPDLVAIEPVDPRSWIAPARTKRHG